jgi:hypothetical protein
MKPKIKHFNSTCLGASTRLRFGALVSHDSLAAVDAGSPTSVESSDVRSTISISLSHLFGIFLFTATFIWKDLARKRFAL